ncbi:hypothetical protein ACFSKW_45025 [Nonomuraea mangrovi]|uniref:Uncharacterized protein n=1 Tax=Nonomuraea mangrovi TaxID=2316207 RepID=A0ABW4T9G3_9ACTN
MRGRLLIEEDQQFLDRAGDAVGLVGDRGVAGVHPLDGGVQSPSTGAGAWR